MWARQMCTRWPAVALHQCSSTTFMRRTAPVSACSWWRWWWPQPQGTPRSPSRATRRSRCWRSLWQCGRRYCWASTDEAMQCGDLKQAAAAAAAAGGGGKLRCWHTEHVDLVVLHLCLARTAACVFHLCVDALHYRLRLGTSRGQLCWMSHAATVCSASGSLLHSAGVWLAWVAAVWQGAGCAVVCVEAVLSDGWCITTCSTWPRPFRPCWQLYTPKPAYHVGIAQSPARLSEKHQFCRGSQGLSWHCQYESKE